MRKNKVALGMMAVGLLVTGIGIGSLIAKGGRR